MRQTFRKPRSDFWITLNENEDAYNISTKPKYVPLIDQFFPELVNSSPKKWRESSNYENMSNLWLPSGYYDLGVISEFINWCKDATKEVLWLGLNRNIQEYFDDELDYCIASDFNFSIEGDRTEIGEAEYQLKYHAQNLSISEENKYTNIIMGRMLENCKYIPSNAKLNWYVSPMPATDNGKEKFAWKMTKEISERIAMPFLSPTLHYDKPEMKQLSVKEKIETWEEIYYNDEVTWDREIRGKRIIVMDDLYQSGTTMWEYAKFLKRLGASCVFGVVCVKSLRDSDNT